jgi:pyruvate dehydrogenase E2 component (dihydrolipoamide acetyltransferase)
MATKVIMPKVDMDQETGTLVEWLKQEGEEIEKGELLFVMETDKVAIEIEAPASGILGGVLAEPGQEVPIAQVIGYILAPGEELPEEVAKKAAPTAVEAEAPIFVAPPTQPIQQVEVSATPVAKKLASESGVDLTMVSGSGPRGKVTKKDVEEALTPAPHIGEGDGKIYATPAARRIAREDGITLAQVKGSGPKGRVQAADVLSAAATAPVTAPVSSGEVEVVPLRGMRRTIAHRMTASYQTTPHITFTSRIDMSRFMDSRMQLNEQAEKSGEERISATAMFVKAVAEVLTRHPWLNSSFQEEEIHLHRDINIGVAVALSEGLIVPVVHNADQKSITQIGLEVNDLSARAREGRLVPSEVSRSTFTISNLGPFGVEQFSAIINPPNAAILAIGATQHEVVPDANDQIVTKPIMHMTLSADHRVVDGALAAYFLADLKEALEKPLYFLL